MAANTLVTDASIAHSSSDTPQSVRSKTTNDPILSPFKVQPPSNVEKKPRQSKKSLDIGASMRPAVHRNSIDDIDLVLDWMFVL